ncbi:MAG: hypothetical protein ACYCQJ_14175 [Nitrososphaerales archaeon]
MEQPKSVVVEVTKDCPKRTCRKRRGMNPWGVFAIFFVVSWILLWIFKPNIVTYTNLRDQVHIDWLKLFLWSLFFGFIGLLIGAIAMRGRRQYDM